MPSDSTEKRSRASGNLPSTDRNRMERTPGARTRRRQLTPAQPAGTRNQQRFPRFKNQAATVTAVPDGNDIVHVLGTSSISQLDYKDQIRQQAEADGAVRNGSIKLSVEPTMEHSIKSGDNLEDNNDHLPMPIPSIPNENFVQMVVADVVTDTQLQTESRQALERELSAARRQKDEIERELERLRQHGLAAEGAPASPSNDGNGSSALDFSEQPAAQGTSYERKQTRRRCFAYCIVVFGFLVLSGTVAGGYCSTTGNCSRTQAVPGQGVPLPFETTPALVPSSRPTQTPTPMPSIAPTARPTTAPTDTSPLGPGIFPAALMNPECEPQSGLCAG